MVVVKAATNQGLCKLVSPSVVATVVSAVMKFPTTVIHGSTTECEYNSKEDDVEAVLIRYDTDASDSTFLKGEKEFEHRGLKLGPITELGDMAYYFNVSAGKIEVTTVVAVQGALQVLTTGTGTTDQIGTIARYALNAYETERPKS
jgi:hypothetical protein